MEQPPISRMIMAGFGLAAIGIVLFLALYFGLTGIDALPRLLLALCVPPLLLALGLGGYLIVSGRLNR
jgi:hypothetical protein